MALAHAYPTPGTKLSTMTEWENLFTRTTVDGIITGCQWEFAPYLDGPNRKVGISTGAAIIRGFYINGPSPTMTPIPAPDTQPRIDRLVLRLDRNASTPTGWIRPEVVTGTAAAQPQAPAHLTTDAGEWDLPICRWTSAPNGALLDLVDERYFNSGGVLAVHSWNRPEPDRDVIARERDTGRWVAWDREQWRVLSEDTGWVPFQPEGLWKAGGYPLKLRKINNIVYLKGSVERTTETLPEKDTDSLVANLWADFRPPEDHWWNAIVSGPSYTSLQLTPSGVLKVRQHADPIGVGRQVFLDTTYMVDTNP